MDLQDLWFALISILFIGFFFLEGFDYGVGILLPFLGKDDRERRVIVNTIGPVWDANEVWMITAGGAIFAASLSGTPPSSAASTSAWLSDPAWR